LTVNQPYDGDYRDVTTVWAAVSTFDPRPCPNPNTPLYLARLFGDFFLRVMPTINQLVRHGRRDMEANREGARAARQSAEARRLHSRLHHDAQEAELGAA
jgi:hypothetical protein